MAIKKLLLPSLMGYLLFLSACSATTLQIVSPTHKFGRSYELNRTYTASTGSPVVRVENLYLRPAFTAIYECQPPGLGIGGIRNFPKLVPGQVWIAIRTIEGEDGYVLGNPDFVQGLGIHVKPDGRIGLGWFSLASGSLLRAGTWPEGPIFREIAGFAEKGSFVAELIYTGLSGSTVRLAYREYLDGTARPAFYQELTYDLKASSVIMFRTIKIEVAEATNSYLSYRVLDDGDLPWMPRQ